MLAGFVVWGQMKIWQKEFHHVTVMLHETIGGARCETWWYLRWCEQDTASIYKYEAHENEPRLGCA